MAQKINLLFDNSILSDDGPVSYFFKACERTDDSKNKELWKDYIKFKFRLMHELGVTYDSPMFKREVINCIDRMESYEPFSSIAGEMLFEKKRYNGALAEKYEQAVALCNQIADSAESICEFCRFNELGCVSRESFSGDFYKYFQEKIPEMKA